MVVRVVLLLLSAGPRDENAKGSLHGSFHHLCTRHRVPDPDSEGHYTGAVPES